MLKTSINHGCSASARVARPGVWLVVLLIAVACYRLTLIGSGHFYEYDEGRQLAAGRLVDDASNGRYRLAIGRLFEAQGRPGFVLISVIPSLVQRVAGPAVGLEPDTLSSYDIASAFNVLVSLAIACCVFFLARVWTGSQWYALLATVIHATLSRSNVWIARLVPFDFSLLLFLLALLIVSSRRVPGARVARTAVPAGILSALGFACYPGYYAFAAINVVVLLAMAPRRIHAGALYGCGFISVVLLFELLARVAGTSYIGNCLDLSGTVRQGLFDEGYVFLWRYLRDVEGSAGIGLFLLSAGLLVLVVARRATGMNRAAGAAYLAAAACYFLHASMGVIFHKLVFYGRILGMYLPFLVAASVMALMQIRPRPLRRLAVCGILVASTVSFTAFSQSYERIAYPADLLFDTLARLGHDVKRSPENAVALVSGQAEALGIPIVMVADALPDGTEPGWLHVAGHRDARASRPRFIGVNFVCVPYFREKETRFVAPEGYRLVAEAPSPLTLAATLYEGRKPWERERLLNRGNTLRIYERVDDTPALSSTSPTRFRSGAEKAAKAPGPGDRATIVAATPGATP